jgi:hypothetical protein
MQRASLLNQDWCHVVDRLGGAQVIEASARDTKAFRRARGIPGAVALLRLVLAYCLRQGGLRSTAAWASAIGLADISNVALLNRLRGCGDWLAVLVGCLLAAQIPSASRARLVRLIDATAVPKAGTAARRGNGVWRVHSAFDLPAERFACFAVTEERGASGLIGSRSSRAKSALPIAPTCSPIASPRCWRQVAMSWCEPDGGTPPGSMPLASRST